MPTDFADLDGVEGEREKMMNYIRATRFIEKEAPYCTISGFKLQGVGMEAIFTNYFEHLKKVMPPKVNKVKRLSYVADYHFELWRRYNQTLFGDPNRKPVPDKETMIIEAGSGGYNATNFASITIDDVPVTMEKNENNHYRGLHIVVINPYLGQVEFAKVFDTYKTSENLELFIESGLIGKHYIVVAACKDDCATNLSKKVKRWFQRMGSSEIWKVKYRDAFAFLGLHGDADEHSFFANESRPTRNNQFPAYVTQVFIVNDPEAPV